MRQRRTRVAIAVEPTILGDALADVLRGAGVDEVVNLRETDAPTGAFDAAVVTLLLPDDVDADVVIELPGSPAGRGETHVRVHGRSARVSISDVEDILRLLDDYCPADEPRWRANGWS
jgi:hypothetical protein